MMSIEYKNRITSDIYSVVCKTKVLSAHSFDMSLKYCMFLTEKELGVCRYRKKFLFWTFFPGNLPYQQLAETFHEIFTFLSFQIIRRSGPEEKTLALVKHRSKHTCSTSWIVIALVAWEGVPLNIADDMYSTMVYKLNKFGTPTERR